MVIMRIVQHSLSAFVDSLALVRISTGEFLNLKLLAGDLWVSSSTPAGEIVYEGYSPHNRSVSVVLPWETICGGTVLVTNPEKVLTNALLLDDGRFLDSLSSTRILMTKIYRTGWEETVAEALVSKDRRLFNPNQGASTQG
jgi:hypothetical protein